MGILDKVKGMLDPDSARDYDDEEDFELDDEGIEGNGYGQYDQSYAQQPSIQQSAGMSINSSALELKVVRPDRFDSVSQIADHLLNKRTVVLNLEATNKETSRRIIDFLSGVAYSINGNIKRVANNTFVITPCNVDVSNDQQAEAPKAAPQQTAPRANTADLYDNI